MATRYKFLTIEGDELITITDGSFFTESMDLSYSTGNCAVEFLDSDGETVVTPTTGTVTFTSAPIGEQYHGPNAGDEVIDATLVDGGYSLPQFDGPVLKSKMTLDGITGASFVRAYHWRA